MAAGTVPGRVRRLGWVLIGLQAAGMVTYSTFQYSRYALTQDFAIYSQAWWSIAHGNLDPWSSITGIAFWQNNAEFAMWPLALLYHVYRQPLLLLWVQDLAVAATEVVTFGWILEVIGRWERQVPRRIGAALALGAVVLMLLDPWCYETIAFDFHLEVFAALFATLAGWDLWAGRTRRLWAWVPLALACDIIGALCVLGVGLSGVLAGRRTRRSGMLLAVAGLGWVLLMGAIGGAGVGGRVTSEGYGYLTGPHAGHLGAVGIAIGAVLHPGVVAQVLASRLPMVFLFLGTVGLIGVFSPWGLGPALVVFAPGLLFVNSVYLRVGASFQSWPALSFVLAGSVMVALRLASSSPVPRRAYAVLGSVWVTIAVIFGAFAVPDILHAWITVDAPAAAELARAGQQIPARAEVIASQGVAGRFADRASVHPYPFYDYLGDPLTTFSVSRPLVVFVFTPHQGAARPPGARTAAAISFVRDTLHARVLDDRNGVYVLAWSPPPGITSITLP